MNIRVNVELNIDTIRDLILNEKIEFPKYVSPLINLANRFAQATRPEVVGQMSELVKECPYKDFEGWKMWYLSKYPNAIDEATNRILNMLRNFREVLEKIDESVVRKWVEDLVLVKTFIGLMVQEPILAYLSKKLGKSYRLATPDEESKGIDGFIDEFSISIKPVTFKEKIGIAEERPSGDVVIYYEKKDGAIIITEIEALTDKGKELVSTLKKLLNPTLDDYFSQ